MEDFLEKLWGLAIQGGPFAAGFAIVLWWLERSERIRLQKELSEALRASDKEAREMTRETVKAMVSAADTVEDLNQFLRAGQAPRKSRGL